ncbi:MAG: hypothetical protein ACK4Z5_04995 [Brevundimonas sp.]
MADTPADWQELFDAYRYEVIRAGFGSWDEAAFANDVPDDEASWKPEDAVGAFTRDDDVSARFERYARAFVRMLACLEGETLRRLLTELGDRVRTRDGLPVTRVIVRSEAGEYEVLSDRYAHEGLIQTFTDLNEKLFAPEDPEPRRPAVYA